MSREIDLNGAMDKLLKQYGEEVRSTVNKEISYVAKATRKKTADKSPMTTAGEPRGATGEYKRDWKSRTTEDMRSSNYSAVVYNKSHYQLTHLLEDGHVFWVKGKRNGTPKKPDARFSHRVSRRHPKSDVYEHIGPAAEWGEKILIKRVVKDIGKI